MLSYLTGIVSTQRLRLLLGSLAGSAALLAALGGAAILPSPGTSALAQESVKVKFDKADKTATMGGTLIGKEYMDYQLHGRSGQLLTVSVTVDGTNGDGSIYFNVLPPGSDGMAIFNSSTKGDGRFGQVRLTAKGLHTIRVYLMGNDRSAGKTVGYTLTATKQSSNQ